MVTNKTRKMVLQVTKTLSMVDDLIFMCTLPLEQSVFTGTFGNPVCAENQNNCNDALEDTGCSTQRIIVLADAPSQGVDINGFRNTLDQAVAKQILDFKSVLFMYLLPTTVLYIPLYMLVSKMHLTNTIWGLIVIYPTFTLPYVAWILIPHIAAVPKELEEAAKVDGCSRIGTMYKIVFPLALPGIISTTIFTFAMCWGEYMYALVNLTSSQVQTFPLVISGLIYGDMPPWNQLMAGGVLAGIPIIVIYMLASSGLVGGATDGGVKG